jgi:uncharacterized protein (DUF1684 family)
MSAEQTDDALVEWANERREYVTSPVGNLALVDFQSVGASEQKVRGFPAVVWRNDDEAGVRIRPTAHGVRLLRNTGESVEVTEEIFFERLQASGYPLLQAGHHTIDAFSLDGSDYELRVYDSHSQKLHNFEDIARYDYDPQLIIQAELDSFAATEQVAWEFTRATDTGHTKSVPGVVRATIGGDNYEFTVFQDGDYLVLVFADGTSGSESYAPGRFLRFAPPAHTSKKVELDFNRAIIPPCGFSDFYSCPIPPVENRVRAAIRAGEQRVIWKNDAVA